VRPHDASLVAGLKLELEYGHIALDLPLGHMVSVGTRFVLDGKDAVTSLVDIDETVPVSMVA